MSVEKPVQGNAEKYSVANTPVDETSPLKDKTYFFLGSSVTFGSGSLQESMVDFLAKRNCCTVIKEAVSGTTLADLDGDSYVKRLERYIGSKGRVSALDAFVCQLSTNDLRAPQSLGAVTDGDVKERSAFDKATTLGAIEYIIATVKETWNCPVVFYTSNNIGNEQYSLLVAELNKIAEKWDIAVLDLYNDEKFNKITEKDYALYMKDSVHPTRAGYLLWWVPRFEKILKSLVNEFN